jgi:endoglucanase
MLVDDRSYEFLRKLLDAPGPSGFEQAPARVWRAEAESFADAVETDLVGNTYAIGRAQAGVENPLRMVIAVATVQEEIAFTGAYTAAVRMAPTVGIAVDVTHATDYPGADKRRDGDVNLGGGPVISRGGTLNPVVYDGLRAAARSLGMACPLQATGNSSGTDADAMIKAGAGCATGLVSIPNRYMHSPNEVVSRADLANAARLIAAFARSIAPDQDFRPR